MKTVIITRDNEYANSPAYEAFSKIERKKGTGKFNAYIHGLFERYLTDYALEEYAKISGTSLPSEDVIRELDNDDEDIGAKIYEENIKCRLDNILADSKPYATFSMDNGNEVTFVFVNEVFGKFVEDYQYYPRFVKHVDRENFIEAICLDCGIEAKELGCSDNTLYIHDLEWGCTGGRYIYVDGVNLVIEAKEARDAYGKYFSRLIVFQHIGITFDQIKTLQFGLPQEVKSKMKMIKG